MRRATPTIFSILIPMLMTVGSGVSAARASADAAPMLGFSDAAATAQRALERRFDAELKADDQREWMRQMASQPNHLGSAHGKANAEFMLAKFKEWGWDAKIERFDVLYPTAKSHSLELIEPTRFTAALNEPPIEGDSTSFKTEGSLPPYNVYGADGDVTAELVYVNYGMPDDYKELARHGVDVKGKIVITRYGHGWRGLKPKLAHEHGAVGCLIYSDPHEDGYFAGDAYPKGGYRPADGVQRGSVLDMILYPGDPLTPGVGSTPDARRLAMEDAVTILKIPVMPISWADAQPLLAALDGQVVPRSWRGALPLTYHIGPGPAKVHMKIESEWTRKPAYDVIARIRGASNPDEWIVRGNHHDGWVFGAWDPLAGNVAMLAEAKAIGALLKQGWKPARTLVYASWDGEEPGLLGSTEWVEAHAKELKQKAVLYLNSDTNSRGFLGAEGSHSLQHLVNQVAAEVRDPQTGVSVDQRLRAAIQVDAFENPNPESQRVAKLAANGSDLPIGGMGSGSDYSAFLQHVGIASLNIGYGGEDEQGGVYHSVYDSFDHYERFGDPGFVYGVALSQTAGRIVLRAANAEVLPMRFGDFAETVARYADEVHKLADSERERTNALASLLDSGAFKLAADPSKVLLPPAREDNVPYIDFAPLDNALVRLDRSTKAYDGALEKAQAAGLDLSARQRSDLNGLLQGMEQTLLDAKGLPGRPWFKHFIYAPGMTTGYGVKTLPSVRESIEDRNWDLATQGVVRTAAVLDAYSKRIEQATLAFKSK
ncbi:MAG TPA: transferrin receptor-like dimerization domain-containing protein [Dokdonella sp.]|uniref:transferrin receptor-like dimerization domain-containing protein n=1 Tax=Dokdonella sp. TaxID=2291710 RepID=UPI002D802A77|nr:transferrin receptor-like dimerization domain-containing protein [Dokdonella sp.]HET9031974.1 transferrin receptor-like dimerization domain-containing protein [Dokdonella sp.]